LSHRFPALIAAPPAAAEQLYLTGARLLDGTGGPAADDASVLVADGLIKEIGGPCPPGARIVDLDGRTLMPGLIDAHTHASGEVPKTAKGAEAPLPGVAAHFFQAELRAYLTQGVTTIRVCGSQGIMPQEARQARGGNRTVRIVDDFHVRALGRDGGAHRREQRLKLGQRQLAGTARAG